MKQLWEVRYRTSRAESAPEVRGDPRPTILEVGETGTVLGRRVSKGDIPFGSIIERLKDLDTLRPHSASWERFDAAPAPYQERFESAQELDEEPVAEFPPAERRRHVKKLCSTCTRVQIAEMSLESKEAIAARGPSHHDVESAQCVQLQTVRANLDKAFDQRRQMLEAKKDVKTLSDVEERQYKNLQIARQQTLHYLETHFDSMIEMARTSPFGAITESKSETGLSYSLRCFCDRDTGTPTFELSFGTLVSGGEADIKGLVNLNTGEQRVKRDLRKERRTEEEQRKELEVIELLKTLEDVPGIAHVKVQRYEGKGGVEKVRPTLEWYPGGDLLDYINAYHGADVRATDLQNKKIAASLVRTVCGMHKKGVVHMDLKPENVLLDKEGRPFVSDFSFAARVQKGGYVEVPSRGTPGWIDPDVLGKSSSWTVNEKQDLWALGMILLMVMCCDITEEYNREIGAIVDGPNPREAVIATVQVLIRRLNNTCCVDQPYGQIIARLLDPNPRTRMSDDELMRCWPQ